MNAQKSFQAAKTIYRNIRSQKSQLKLDDVLSLGYINNLITGLQYLPFTGWSLRPYCLAFILNEILINNRENILEFGGGISTVLMARLAKVNALNIKITSIEHNEEWINKLTGILKKEDLLENVEFIFAPLKETQKSLNNLKWYSEDVLSKTLNERKFDLVLVDGPPADQGLERFPAIPFLIDKLANSYCLFLDDAHREGEQMIFNSWQKSYQMQFDIVGETLAICRKGSFFDSNPVIYSVL